MTPVSDADIQLIRKATFLLTGSEGVEAIGAFARVEIELRALRAVGDAAERVYAEPTGYVEKAEAWDDFAAALRDAGRLW